MKQLLAQEAENEAEMNAQAQRRVINTNKLKEVWQWVNKLI